MRPRPWRPRRPSRPTRRRRTLTRNIRPPPAWSNNSTPVGRFIRRAPDLADLGPWVIDYPGDYPDAARKAPPRWGSGPARLGVFAPAGAELRIDGQKQPAAPETKWRTFLTPPLAMGGDYHYKVSARWSQDGRTVEDERNVAVHANGWASVDFTRPERDHPAR